MVEVEVEVEVDVEVQTAAMSALGGPYTYPLTHSPIALQLWDHNLF